MDIRNIDPRDRQIIVDSLRCGRTLDADRAEELADLIEKGE